MPKGTNWTNEQADAAKTTIAMNSRKERVRINSIPLPEKRAQPPVRKGRTPHKEVQEQIYKHYLFFNALSLSGVPLPTAEYKFHPTRKWRFDFCWAEDKLALEVEGGIWMSKHGGKSRHFTGSGATADMEKYNAAAVLGYRILKVVPTDLCKQKTIDMIKSAFWI